MRIYFFYLLLPIVSLLFIMLTFPFLTVFFSRFRKEKAIKNDSIALKQFDYGNIITAYRNVEIAKGLVESLLRQNYENQHIYLVADNADIADWDISDPRLTVLKPEPALNLKAKSIIYAVERFVRPHEYITIFDADNLAHPDFLKTINEYANQGHLAIQGQRTAKNLNTTMAAADAMGEFYKNFTEREVPYLLGSSSVISGSGMAVEANLYKTYLYGEEITKTKEQWKKMLQEDKILQNDLVGLRDVQIVYAKKAICYDEKVTTADAVETQRSRWLFSYFQNFPNAVRLILGGIRAGSWNQFFFGLVTINLPMFILLGIAIMAFVISLFVNYWLAGLMAFGIFIFGSNILLSLRLGGAPSQVWQAIWGLPVFVFRQFTALFKMRNPNKNFKHSEHVVKVSIDEVLNKK